MNEPWLVSPTGRCISVQNPRPADIDLFDVARGLADERRYGNRLPVNVAHHSCMVAEVAFRWAQAQRLPNAAALGKTALFHDASEAYLGDVIQPVKRFLPDYAKLEHVWMTAIAKRFDFDLSLLHHPILKDADYAVHQCEVVSHCEEPQRLYGFSDAALTTFIPGYFKEHTFLETLRNPWSSANATINFLNYCATLNVS